MFNKLSVAVAAALFSSSAFALAPGSVANFTITLSGASAQDNGIARLFDDICVPNTLHTYKDGTTTAPATGKKHQAYFCTVDRTQVTAATAEVGATDAGALTNFLATNPNTNPNVLFYKRSEGGSGQGVGPVITQTAIDFMVVNSTNCTLTTTANLYSCSVAAGTTASLRPDAGTSDVNPEMFVGANGVPTAYDSGVAGTVGLKTVGGAALLFGIPVSEPLYRALQAVQNKDSTTIALDANGKVTRDNEANMPSLSKEEVASIMSGRIKNWNSLKVAGTNTGLRDYYVNTLVGPAPASALVNICRRTNGSGTQAQMSAKYLNYPCTAGAVAPTETSNTITGPVVYLGAGSGDVDTCLNTAGTLGTATPVASNVAAGIAGSPGNNRWAVGIQSLEKNFLVANAYPLNYRFVKIDGVAPTLANAANGKYFNWVENTYQWRTAATANPIPQDEMDIMFTIASNAGKTSIVRDVLNPPLVYGFGQSGYLALDTALPTTLNVPSCPFVDTNPVMPYTHTVPSGLDNCRTPVVFATACM